MRQQPATSVRRDTLGDILLAAVAATLLTVLFVVIPAGVLAALVLDQVNSIESLAGEAAPLPYRLFFALQLWLPRFIPVALLGVVLHCALRRRRKPALSLGDDLVWDALVSPLQVAVAAFLLGTILLAVTARRLPDGDSLKAVAAAAVAVAVALGAVGLLAGLFRRFKSMRMLLTATVMLLVLLPLIRIGADARGKAQLGAYGRSLEPEFVAERQRMAAARSPLLRGTPIDEDAMPRYLALRTRVAAMNLDPQAIGTTAAAGPQKPLSPAAQKALDQGREPIRALREAVRCTRSVGDLRPSPPGETVPSRLPWRTLAELATVEGHERAQAGDASGAAEHYLDVVRFGGDLKDGPIIDILVSNSIESLGLEALDALLVSSLRPPLAQVQAELGKLSGRLPTLAAAYRQERLYILGSCALVDKPGDVFAAKAPLPLVIPYRLLLANAVAAADPRWRAMERGEPATTPGPELNPFFRLISPASVEGSRLSLRLLEARFALSRGLVAIESQRSPTGTYPADAAALSLAMDPLAPGQPLHYQPSPDRRGYKLWSVGRNEQDDGGTAKDKLDLVAER